MRVGVKVFPTTELNWILAQEPTHARVVVAHAIFVDSSLGIKLAGSVLERIDERARRSGQLAERVVVYVLASAPAELLRDVTAPIQSCS